LPGNRGREIPAGVEIHREPRKPEFDPTLNVPVEVDRTGSPKNRLVTIGDSITHGFMSGAIFRTDLSWPAVVAFELGNFETFRRPSYEAPSGPGGIPLDIERALRAFEAPVRAEAGLVRDRACCRLAARLPGRDRGLLGTRGRHQADSW
jgi:hypothetical protein